MGECLLQPGAALRLPIGGRARWIVLATACDFAAGPPEIGIEWLDDDHVQAELDALGERVAGIAVQYRDGGTWATALRRRFETAPPYVAWGQQPMLARAHSEDEVLPPEGPYAAAMWGWHQLAVRAGDVAGPRYWLTAIENPRPQVPIAALEVGALGSALLVGAVTISNAEARPLSAPREIHVALDGLRDADRIRVLDGYLMGIDPCEPPTEHGWTTGSVDDDRAPAHDGRQIVRIAASVATRIRVGRQTIQPDLLQPLVASDHGHVRATLLPHPTVPVRLRLVEAGREVAGRVHVRAADGRELAAVDRSRIVSDRWFEDRGTEVRLGSWSYAYIDGSMDLLAPDGPLFIEVSRGPEFEVLRTVREVNGPTTIELSPVRIANMRAEGWLASDTHVHFLSPARLHLQARAEGLQLVHLLSAQWGELFTNVEDLRREAAIVSDEAVVWTGTENRHHVLGHLISLGTPEVRPLSSGGPDEARLGGATSVTIADWADQARSSGGLAVLAHFPSPYLEAVADLLLGRVDAVELWFVPRVLSHRLREYYRFLDMGLRIPLVSGTDKMEATFVLGSTRTYTHTGDSAIDFATWAAAVRAGRTFVSTGPLLQASIEGMLPGSVVGQTGHLEIEWRLRTTQPLEAVELVVNREVVQRIEVADRSDQGGSMRVECPSAGWVAMRAVGGAVVDVAGFPYQVGAHTSPWYLPESAVPDPAEIARFKLLLDGAEAWADITAWSDEAAESRLRALIAEAHSRLDRLAAEASRRPRRPRRCR